MVFSLRRWRINVDGLFCYFNSHCPEKKMIVMSLFPPWKRGRKQTLQNHLYVNEFLKIGEISK